jgi:hypothetical protein
MTRSGLEPSPPRWEASEYPPKLWYGLGDELMRNMENKGRHEMKNVVMKGLKVYESEETNTDKGMEKVLKRVGNVT